MNIASVVSTPKVVVIFTFLIGGLYGFVVPAFFPNYKTYSILIVGVSIAALIGGYIGYRVPTSEMLLVKIGVGFCYAVVVTALVMFLSLFIILNVRGS